MKHVQWLLLAVPLLMFGCTSAQDKTVSKTTDENILPPTKQTDQSGGGAATAEAKTEDRTKPEF